MTALERCLASTAAALLVMVTAHDARAAGMISCTIPGFEQAAFGDAGVNMSNGSTDSYDSSLGTYATTACSTLAPTFGSTCVAGIATNATANGAIVLGPNADVNGGCSIGSGGNTSAIACDSAHEPTCTAPPGPCNGTSVLSSPITLTSVIVPSYPAGTTPTALPAAITPSKSYSTMSFSGASSLILTLNGSGDYVIDGLTLGGSASLALTPGTKAVIFMTKNFDIGGNGITNPGGKPTDLIIMCSDAVTDAKINGNGAGAFGLYCPKAAVTITGNGEVFGAVVGKTVSFSGSNGKIHYDKALGSVMTNVVTCPAVEVSRAQPVIAQITCDNSTGAPCPTTFSANTYESLVQGTYEAPQTTLTTISAAADVTAFEFPWIKGHMRARIASNVGTTASSYSSGGVLFDAGATGMRPTRTYGGCSSFTGSCRKIFTNTNSTSTTGTTRYPAMVGLDDTTAATVGALITPGITLTSAESQTLVRKVLDAKLGGVDRSTVAVIEESSFAGPATRPKMAYFGATDGMLHAVCASISGSCTTLGKEMWAFLPRAQLALIGKNKARVDGSVHVIDAFGDFTPGTTGKKSWRTVLIFQTGFHDSNVPGSFPAAYALDVSDPTAPSIIWEYTTPTVPDAMDFGTGLDVAAGPSLYSGQRTEQAVLETNNHSGGNSGVVAVAIEIPTGTRKWKFDEGQYVVADAVPATGLPGGAVGVDPTESGYYSQYVFGDLYGRLWRVNATTGDSDTGGLTTPLFQFSNKFKPIGASPALYQTGGKIYAAFASGGYMDQNNTAWTTGSQYLIVARLNGSGPYPLNESSPGVANEVRLAQVLTGVYGSFATPTVVGDQVLVNTDSGNVNASTYGTGTGSTGKVFVFGMAAPADPPTTFVVTGGAAGIVNNGTTLYAASGSRQQRISSDAVSTVGQSVDLSSFSKTTRSLWLRTE